jgi:hypothetical protein
MAQNGRCKSYEIPPLWTETNFVEPFAAMNSICQPLWRNSPTANHIINDNAKRAKDNAKHFAMMQKQETDNFREMAAVVTGSVLRRTQTGDWMPFGKNDPTLPNTYKALSKVYEEARQNFETPSRAFNYKRSQCRRRRLRRLGSGAERPPIHTTRAQPHLRPRRVQ